MINEDNLSDFIRLKIRQMKESNGITTNGLSYRTGISQSYLREIENGTKCNISVDKLFIICQSLGITLKDFFDEEFELSESSPLQAKINSMSASQQEKLLDFLNSIYF